MTSKNQPTDNHPLYAEPYLEDPAPAPDYAADARAITWAAGNNRLAEAAGLVPILEEQGEITRNAQVALAQAQHDLAEAVRNEDATRDRYNLLRGTGQAMKDAILKQCSFEGVPIPQDPEPANPPLVQSCDHLTCPGCSSCGCHTNPVQEPVAERPLDGAS